MEALLEKIVHNTEPKSSLQIIVSNNKTRFKTRFNPPIQLDKTKQYEDCPRQSRNALFLSKYRCI